MTNNAIPKISVGPTSRTILGRFSIFFFSDSDMEKKKLLSQICFYFEKPITYHVTGLDIGLVGPVARGASRFENLLAPQKSYWPGGPVDLKTYWPPKKLTGPPKN